MDHPEGEKGANKRRVRAPQLIETAPPHTRELAGAPSAQQNGQNGQDTASGVRSQVGDVASLQARFDALALATGQITWTARGDGTDDRDRDGRAWRLFTGQAPTDGADSWPWLAALHPDDRERAAAAWSAAVASTNVYEIEYRARRYDGEYRQLLVRAAPVLNTDGTVREWGGVATDITDRKRAEQMLTAQNQVLELIASGRPLDDTLAALSDAITRQQPETHAVVVLEGADLAALPSHSAVLLPEDADVRAASVAGLIMALHDTDDYSNRSLTSPDIAHDERWPVVWRDRCIAHGIHACHIEPVLAPGGQTLASFALYFDHARAPRAWELQLARLGAHTTRIAIERAQADQALRESKRLLDLELSNAQLLQRLSGQMALKDDLDTLYQQILDVAVAMMRSDMGSLQMYVADQDVLHLLAWKGFDPTAAAFWSVVRADSTSSCGVALRARTRQIVPDVETCAYMAGTEDLAYSRLSGIRAVQSTPLIARDGRMLGMISTHWRTQRQPDERELRLLDVLARQAADLIERVRARGELRESEARLRMALDSSSSGTFVWYVDDDRGEPDAQMRRLFGVPDGGELNLAVALATMIHIEDRERYASAVARAVDPTGSGALKEDIRVVMPDGSERWLAITGQVYFQDQPRRPLRMAGTATDITARKRTEEALRASELALQQANQRKDEFLGIASHELRTPLTSAKASVEIVSRRLARTLALADDDSSPALARLRPLQPVLARSASALDRLNRLVADLLDVTRIQAGKLEMRLERMNLIASVRESVEEETQIWTGRSARLEIDAPTDDEIWVLADSDRIHQVVVNFLSNAFKYGTPEQPTVIHVGRRGRLARVAVSDGGPGLSSEQQMHLFERFYRVEGIPPQQGSAVGLGLGLAICRDIIERHSGQVGVESAPGSGSTFWFTLPISPDSGPGSAQDACAHLEALNEE